MFINYVFLINSHEYSHKEKDFGVVGEHTLEVSTVYDDLLLMQPLSPLAREEPLNVTWSE